MKVVKKTADYTVYQKRSERYAVQGPDKAWINGDDKAKILLDEGLIKVVLPKPPEPEPEAESEDAPAAEEAAAEDVSAEADAPAGDAPEGD